MTSLVISVIGLMLSALLHYLYRNTYVSYEKVDGVRVWTKKVTLRRKFFLMYYGINVIPLVNLVVLVTSLVYFYIEQNEYDFHFEVKNKFTEWLEKEV